MYGSRACQKTPMTNLGIYPNVRRIYPIDVPIGNITVPLNCKLLCRVVATVHVFICTVQTRFQYIRSKWVQIYWVYEILNSTGCTWKTVELWRVVSWPIPSQFSKTNTRLASTRRVLFLFLLVLYTINHLLSRIFLSAHSGLNQLSLITKQRAFLQELEMLSYVLNTMFKYLNWALQNSLF